MNSQLINLYSLLQTDRYMTAEELANRLGGVSTKTVRNCVKALNMEIQPYEMMVTSKHGSGFVLEVGNEEKRTEFNAYIYKEEEKQNTIPDSVDERVTFLLRYFLQEKKYINLDDLSEYLYISRKTLVNNIRDVEKVLNSYNLSFERKPGQGIRVVGEEADIRECLLRVAQEAVGVQEDGNSTWIRELIEDKLQEYDVQVNPLSLESLTMHVRIACLRMEMGEEYRVHYPDEELDKISRHLEYALAEDIYNELKDRMGVSPDQHEIAYLAAHLSGDKIISSYALEEQKAYLEDIARQMLQIVYDAFNYDFRDNPQILTTLCQHLGPLTVRLAHHINHRNPLLNEVKEKYTLAYVMASSACVILGKLYRTIVSEDEISYIALFFALLLAQTEQNKAHYKGLLVSDMGLANAQLQAYGYMRDFSMYFDDIQITDSTHLEDVDRYDIVLSTGVLNIDRDYVLVSPITTDKDRTKLRQVLLDEQTLSCEKVFKESLFVTHVKKKKPADIIRLLCDMAYEQGYTEEGFYESVMMRESLLDTSFANKVVIPHPTEVLHKQPFAAVAVLDEPVEWGNHQAQVVIMIGVTQQEREDIRRFYSVLGSFMTRPLSVKKLIEEPDYDNFIRMLRDKEVRGG